MLRMTERLLALAVLASSGVYLANGLSLPFGTRARPGPGFFPLAVALFGAVVALAWVASTFRQAPAALGGAAALPERRRVSTTAGPLIGFCLLLPWTGYPLAALVFTGLLLRGLGAEWMRALIIGFVSALVSYYVFGVLLGVPLPRGAFFD